MWWNCLNWGKLWKGYLLKIKKWVWTFYLQKISKSLWSKNLPTDTFPSQSRQLQSTCQSTPELWQQVRLGLSRVSSQNLKVTKIRDKLAILLILTQSTLKVIPGKIRAKLSKTCNLCAMLPLGYVPQHLQPVFTQSNVVHNGFGPGRLLRRFNSANPQKCVFQFYIGLTWDLKFYAIWCQLSGMP